MFLMNENIEGQRNERFDPLQLAKAFAEIRR